MAFLGLTCTVEGGFWRSVPLRNRLARGAAGNEGKLRIAKDT
jgi:hypothetical protein